jgi:ribosomal protein L37E
MSAGKYRKDHDCLNCGFHVEKHYCSSCGQPNLELKENFWQFISHSIAHYFHFDNKFFQTLVPLLTKPGKVTLDYLAGKRARYINPISMYIFVSIVYFLVVSPPKPVEKTKKENKIAITKAQQKAMLDSIGNPLAKAGIDKEFSAVAQQALEQNLDKETFKSLTFKQQDTVLKNLKATYQTNKSDSLLKVINKLNAIHIVKNDSTYAAYLARQETLVADERDNFIERYLEKRRINIGQNSEIINDKLEHNRPKQYFLFMPLMALFIMFNFRRNHIKYLDHLIFTIHGMTAFFMVSIIVQPIKRILPESLSLLASFLEIGIIIWICWYLFKSLKIFYQRKTSTTIWRMLWVIILYVITLKIAETIMVNLIFYLAT